mgnify:FL=1
MDNKGLSNTKWKCQYHIVFIPKYKKKIQEVPLEGIYQTTS